MINILYVYGDILRYGGMEIHMMNYFRNIDRKKIHIDFVYTPMYNSVYIKGINNLYEKDCGACSGWVYTVNGQTTDCGASAYKLKDGDEIQWTYIIR